MARKTSQEKRRQPPISRRLREQKVREEQELARFDDDDEAEAQEDPVAVTKKAAGRSGKASKKPIEPEESESGDESEDDAESANEDEESSDEEDREEGKKTFFSDENADWLKPKGKASKLMESSDDDNDEGDNDDDNDEEEVDDDDENDEEGEDDDDLLEIEREAKLVDEEMELEKAEAEEELRRTVREHTAVYHLPTPEELTAANSDRVVPPSELRQHVESILEVLADFKNRREAGRARKDYMDSLGVFLAELYGYLPELVEYFLTMFGPTETVEFVDASDKPRPMVVRTNTLKARRKDLAAALIKRGVSLDPLASWSKVGLKIVESPVPMGATPEYLGGMYMLQSAASMCPVLALSPLPQEKVLDLSSAPGGKTSYMAQLMKNTGVIMANDLKPARQKATVANMHRLGVKNVIACAHDGRKLGHMFKNRFDRVLLDAPCSGLGVISRDPSVKVQRTIADVKQCGHLQKELILAAIDSLKSKNTTGGVMVYSTCSISLAENEEVVQYALSKRDIKLIDTGLDFGTPGFTRYQQRRFHPTLALTRRFYPHVHNMDGFFVAKIQKLSDKILSQPDPEEAAVDKEDEDAMEEEPEKVEEKKRVTKGKKKSPFSKKRKGEATQDVEEKPKKNKVSIAPGKATSTKKKSKKTRMNAKMTQPRRKKATADIAAADI
jgi:ribosomal RNA methyltransferase Nop2